MDAWPCVPTLIKVTTLPEPVEGSSSFRFVLFLLIDHLPAILPGQSLQNLVRVHRDWEADDFECR